MNSHLQGVEEPPLAVPSGRSPRNGTSFRSFRSKAQSVQSVDDAQSQQHLEEGEYDCQVDCWNGAYVESKAADSAFREGQDWLAHNQELLHQLQVCLGRLSIYVVLAGSVVVGITTAAEAERTGRTV